MGLNFIDFAIIFLLIIAGIKGYRKGFIGSIVGFLGSIIALVLSIKLYIPFAGLLNAKFGILSSIHGFLAEHMPLPVEVSAAPINTTGANILVQKVNNMVLPQFLKMQIADQAQELIFKATQFGLTTIGEVIIYMVALTLLNGLALIVLWVLLTNLINIVAMILSKSLDNTLLGGINRLGGLTVGLLLNCLGLVVFFGVFTLFLGVLNQADSSMLVAIGKVVNQSVLVPFFKEGYEILLSKVISLI